VNAVLESVLALGGIGFAVSLVLHLVDRGKRIRNLVLGTIAPSLVLVATMSAGALLFEAPPSATAADRIRDTALLALLVLPLGVAGALIGGVAAIGVQLLLSRD
jgi:hypothetical protein